MSWVMHDLSADEVEAISSILDEEESILNASSMNHTNVNALDDQCRQIWPDWQPTPSSKYKNTHSPQKIQRNNQTISPIQSNYYELRNQLKTPSPNSTKPIDIDEDDDVHSLKHEVDTLFYKIRGITSSDDSPPPIRKQVSKHDSPIFSTRFSPSIDVQRNDYSSKAKYRLESSNRHDYDIPSPQYHNSPKYSPDYSNHFQKPPSPKYSPPHYSSKFSPLPSSPASTNDDLYDEPDYDSFSKPHVQFELTDTGSPTKYDPNTRYIPSVEVPSTDSDKLKQLRQENVRLQAELMKVQNRLHMEQEENRRLIESIKQNEKIRLRYKDQLNQYIPRE